jgi:P4 family phage/plasmid primase-like protien
MKKEIQKYLDNDLVSFSIHIEQKMNNKNIWKKNIRFPIHWDKYTLENNYINEKYNGVALLTGKINNIIVIDIDNIEHWNKLLSENKQKEPDTIKAISGSGGVHLYFQYSDEFENIKSNSKCFGSEYDIDIRNNGGCIIAPPTSYFNKNLNKDVEYKWEKNIFNNKLKQMPNWIKKLLLEKKTDDKTDKSNINLNKNDIDIEKKKKNIQNKINNNIIELQNLELNQEDAEIDFTSDDIETLVNMLSINRCENYNDWVSTGMCLFNISKQYLYVWRKWSQKSEKYEDGSCESKWKSFKKTKEGLKIGSLLLWAKTDSNEQYDLFIKKKKLNGMIISKYPGDNLVLGDTVIVNDKCQYTQLNNKGCFIKGCEHNDMPRSMYVEVLDKFMTIKCRHPECFGKTYPCNHILMNKNEMNIAFNGDITININNTDDELVEFQKIDIYEDEKLNELVYNSLNGESYPLAEIIYHYYKDTFNYGEDENWYFYKNHRWENIGKKNMKLRHLMQPILKDIYVQLYNYYKESENEKNKLKSIKQIISSFDNTTLKNNIVVELTEIYSENNNPDRNFTKKLDSNNYLVGFNNGIYDLQTFTFRDGKPDDFVTMSVGYDYKEQHTDKYNGLLQFLEDIHPNKEEREYMLTYLSVGLIGNLLELFTILTGCGRNGKSKLVELLKVTFGDYFGSVQSQLFTRPRPDANSPDPGLLNLMKKKMVMASEPEKNSKLNSGFIKFITGRDSTTLRNCHSNDMIDFTANFITLLICNDIPECDDIDNAFSKRLRCINFPTEFVMEPIKDNQKKIDVNINKNFDYWKLDFMLLLIDYYKKYSQTHELKPTENILKWTNQYKEDTDMYLQFLNECTEENKDGHIHCSTLYGEFKEWFKINNPNSKIPSNKEFINNIKKHKEVIKVKVEGLTQLGIRNIKLTA